MKKLATLAALWVCSANLALAGEWVGWLADQKCAEAGKAASDKHAACARKCVEAGEDIVFVNEADGKVYEIDDFDKAEPHVGKKVTVAGDLDEDFIEVESIKPVN